MKMNAWTTMLVSALDVGAGFGTLHTAVPGWDLLKEITIIFITSTMVWSQIKQQRGNTALPIKQKIGLKIY